MVLRMLSLMYRLKSVWAFPPLSVCFIAEKGGCLRIRRLVFSRPSILLWCCKSLYTFCKTLHRARLVRGMVFKQASKGGRRKEGERKRAVGGEKGRKEKSEESREGGSGDAGTMERELGLGTPLAVQGARSSGVRRGSARRRGGGSGGGEELSQTSSSHRVDVERGP